MTHRQITEEYSAHMYWLKNLKSSLSRGRLEDISPEWKVERLQEIRAQIDKIRDELRLIYSEPLGHAVAIELEKSA
jgi:hypothetical protein